MELDSRKKSRRDGMMRSKSFETQVREIGRKEAKKCRGLIEVAFQMETKGMQRPGEIENVKENQC